MQAEIVIPAHEGITAAPIDVKPCAASRENGKTAFVFVIFSLEVVFPVSVFVNFVKNQKFRAGFKRRIDDLSPVFAAVSIEVRVFFEVFSANLLGKGCFSDLARPSDKNHLFSEIGSGEMMKISFLSINVREYLQVYYTKA